MPFAPTLIGLLVKVKSPTRIVFGAVLVIPPVSVRVSSPSVCKRPLEDVTAAVSELVPALVIAPFPPTPFPVILMGSAILTPPAMRSVAPEATTVLLLVAPRAEAFAAVSVPTLTVVTPV